MALIDLLQQEADFLLATVKPDIETAKLLCETENEFSSKKARPVVARLRALIPKLQSYRPKGNNGLPKYAEHIFPTVVEAELTLATLEALLESALADSNRPQVIAPVATPANLPQNLEIVIPKFNGEFTEFDVSIASTESPEPGAKSCLIRLHTTETKSYRPAYNPTGVSDLVISSHPINPSPRPTIAELPLLADNAINSTEIDASNTKPALTANLMDQGKCFGSNLPRKHSNFSLPTNAESEVTDAAFPPMELADRASGNKMTQQSAQSKDELRRARCIAACHKERWTQFVACSGTEHRMMRSGIVKVRPPEFPRSKEAIAELVFANFLSTFDYKNFELRNLKNEPIMNWLVCQCTLFSIIVLLGFTTLPVIVRICFVSYWFSGSVSKT